MMAFFFRAFFLVVAIQTLLVANVQAGEPKSSPATPTINVTQFVIDHFVAYPKQKITLDSINAIFATWQKKLGTQLTMQQINGVSDEITRLYRANGFMLARALVLPQKITDGIVHLRIEPGTLSEIVVAGQKQTHGDIIARPFQPLLKNVVKKSDIEAALAQVDALPGLDAFSYFSAGDLAGETRINIKVLKEEKIPTQSNLRFDNFGNKSTGEYRLLGDVQVANIFGYGERYQLGALQTMATDSSTLGYLYGSFPFFHAFWRQSIYLSNSQFQLGDNFKILEISGRGHEAHLGWQYDNFLSQQPKFDITLGDYVNKVESEVVGAAVNRDNHVIDLQLGARKNWQGEHQQYSVNAIFIGGHQSGQVDGMDADYAAIDLKNFGQWILSKPGKQGSWGLDCTLRLLLSDSALPNHAQLVLAGPTVNRGFLPGIAAADLGYSWQTQLYSPLVFSSPQLQPFLFVDISGGKRFALDESASNEATNFDTQLQLISTGFGLQTQFNPAFSFNLSWGYGLRYDSKSNGVTTDLLDKDQQLYGTFTYFWK